MIRELDSYSYVTLRAHSTWFPSSTTIILRQFVSSFKFYWDSFTPQRYAPNWVHPMLPHYTGCQNTFLRLPRSPWASEVQTNVPGLDKDTEYRKIQQYLYLKATDRKELTIELLSDQRFRVRRSLCVHAHVSIVRDCILRVIVWMRKEIIFLIYCRRISETKRPFRTNNKAWGVIQKHFFIL